MTDGKKLGDTRKPAAPASMAQPSKRALVALMKLVIAAPRQMVRHEGEEGMRLVRIGFGSGAVVVAGVGVGVGVGAGTDASGSGSGSGSGSEGAHAGAVVGVAAGANAGTGHAPGIGAGPNNPGGPSAGDHAGDAAGVAASAKASTGDGPGNVDSPTAGRGAGAVPAAVNPNPSPNPSLNSGRDTHDRQWPATLIDHALSAGLIAIDGEMIHPTETARPFLRRALSENDETFLAQHGEIVGGVTEIGGARQSVRRNLDESPLSGVARLKDRDGRPYLPEEAIDAGERLAADFTRGQLQPRITASWEPRLSARGRGASGIPQGQGDIADSAIEARQRFGEAVEALGPELSGVAVDVCCFSKGLELIERERQWPARSAKLMLRAALLSLARHYAPPVARAGRRSHRWGDQDYRPKIG